MEIDGYENYLIYEDGRVQNKKTKRFLKQKNNNGYYSVGLCNNKKQKYFYIHRLIGLHYLERVEGKDCIDHIDRNKTNNHISNLRWCNHNENMHNKKYNEHKVSKKNKLGIKNIYYCETYKKYLFKIMINKKTHIKGFKTLEECIEYKDKYLANIN